jgi:hypothetical protein
LLHFPLQGEGDGRRREIGQQDMTEQASPVPVASEDAADHRRQIAPEVKEQGKERPQMDEDRYRQPRFFGDSEPTLDQGQVPATGDRQKFRQALDDGE